MIEMLTAYLNEVMLLVAMALDLSLFQEFAQALADNPLGAAAVRLYDAVAGAERYC